MARHGDEGRGESFSYALGAVASFAVLGLAIVLLRAGGDSVGWGFQLQSPIAVAGFALLVFAVALNLSGLFRGRRHHGGRGTDPEGRLHRRLLHRGAGGGGGRALHRALHGGGAGLCPDAGAALALAVFVALGLGFALPFILLGIWPRALSFLPRPGPWMLTFKQFLAFPMYAAAAWLVWVLAQEADRAASSSRWPP